MRGDAAGKHKAEKSIEHSAIRKIQEGFIVLIRCFGRAPFGACSTAADGGDSSYIGAKDIRKRGTVKLRSRSMTGSQNIIGPHVRRLRCQQGLTQEQLAELAELSVPYISEVERGKKTISVDALYRISCALKVRLTTLFKEVPLEPRSKRAIEKVRT